MKRLLFFLIPCGLIFFSCTEDDFEEQENPEYSLVLSTESTDEPTSEITFVID